MSSIADRVVATGVAVGGVTLAVVGLATGIALHVEQVHALDRALLAAAHERARQGPEPGTWEVEHSLSPVRTRVEEGPLPERHGERPQFVTRSGERMLFLPVEVDGHGETERHALVIASARSPSPLQTVGPFAVLYTGVASLTSLLAGLALRTGIHRAFAPLRAARDQASGAAALARDQRLEADGPDEVRELLDALNELLTRRDAAYGAQARFTAEAAHELRTPVTAMLGELDVALRRDRDAAEYRQILVSTREEVERLRRLVAGLTTLARLDAGHAEADRELVRGREIADAALRAEHVPAELIVEDDPELEVNRALVESALGNLLRNAARHGRPPVVLRVTARGFVVDDAGAGLPPSERDAVFDRFSRGGEARRADRDGLGLGLSLAREVARRHGGDLTLGAAPSGGLRAELRLRGVAEGP